MKRGFLQFSICLILVFFIISLKAQESTASEFLKYDYDEDSGKVFLYVPADFGQFIYVNYLSSGLGSNDIGLDRGQIGDTRLVQFEKYGNKLLLVEDNLDYRAISDNPLEAKSVKEAFARSTIEAFKIIESENDVYKIDITSFIVSDAHGVVQNLKRQKQGSYEFNANRSVVDPLRCKSFPENTEFEAIVTFVGEPSGRNLRSVVADSRSFSLGVHHSFVRLPDDKYKPRKFHPACGYFPMSYQDYAVPIEEDLTQRYIYRHRLEKKNPDQDVSEPIEPIVYYIDAGCPEPIKSALMDGAAWWDDAFKEAGFENAFQIKELPEGADPLDVRYNMIQWVHRSTRGWSYGAMVADPRTGEIIKGHVSLGSLRVRQDYLIMQGLLSPFDDEWSWEGKNPMKEVALARLRQLAAHEVGHTIGLAHNFAASTQNRASVMDYPHPKINLVEGQVDLSEAYDDKIGLWDIQTIKYGYQLPNAGETEEELLESIIRKSALEDFKYITDSDARPKSGAHSQAHLWDNSNSPVHELNHLSEIRSIALSKIGENSILGGIPYSELEKVWTPIYMMHRYQVEAVSKAIGGYEYNYGVKGSGSKLQFESVPEDEQWEAIDALISTLSEKFLNPTDVSSLIPPAVPGYGSTRESIRGNMGLVFDPDQAASISLNHTLSMMLVPERMNRIMYQSKTYGSFSLKDYFARIESGITSFSGVYRDVAQYVYLSYLMHAFTHKVTSVNARIAIYETLKTFENNQKSSGYWFYLLGDFWREGNYPKLAEEIKTPPGSPIGCGH